MSSSEFNVLDQLCESEFVFVGKIENVLTAPGRRVFEYKIWPRESLKGRVESPAFALVDSVGIGGYQFHARGRYLIFANRRDDSGYLSVGSCTLTRPFDQDDNVYRILAENKYRIDEVCAKESVQERRIERRMELIRERLRERCRKRWETQKILQGTDWGYLGAKGSYCSEYVHE